MTAVIAIIGWIVVVVSAITLLNTLMLSVLDRRREIGVLRAIGSTRRFTRNAILAEAAGIGIVGGILGLILGSAIQYLISVAMTNVLSIDVAWEAGPTMIFIALFAIVHLPRRRRHAGGARCEGSTSSRQSVPTERSNVLRANVIHRQAI